jgi:hypothetical protein
MKRWRAIQTAIGQGLREIYDASPDLPRHVRTTLMQLNADQPATDQSRTGDYRCIGGNQE